jgi:hypothetical protein
MNRPLDNRRFAFEIAGMVIEVSSDQPYSDSETTVPFLCELTHR